MASKQKSPGYKVIDGIRFKEKTPDWIAILWLFHNAPRLEQDPYWRQAGMLEPNPAQDPYTGQGRYSHVRQFSAMFFRESFEWSPWSEKAMEAFCSNEQVAITGCAGSSKSTTAALYALIWYLCEPNNSAVLVASTTIDSAKKRIYKEISRLYSELARKLGASALSCVSIGNPRPSICPVGKDGKRSQDHGIYVVAVAGGETDKGVNFLKGFHPPRLMMIGDELDSINSAVVEVGPNQRVGTVEYQTIWLGNDPSLLNPLGDLMAQEPGKPITLDMKEWVSAKGIKCLRFDGYDSPNIVDKDKWTGLIRQKDIDAAVKQHGDNSPQVWIMIRGIHPPEGADDTVLSEATLTRFHAFEQISWMNTFITSAMLDPGFGGDPCTYRTMKRGIDTFGKLRVLLGEVIKIPIRADDKHSPPEYQIASRVVELCKERQIPPTEFILDSTGIGRGTAAVLQVQWSPAINLCDFGGAASDMIVSEENPRPAKDLYDRQVTELYFSIREFVLADMIRGMDNPTARQLCSRRHYVKGTGTGKRSALEKKEEMPSSPNEADALACGIKLLRMKGINASVQTEAKREGNKALESFVRESDFDSNPDCYSDELVYDEA